MSPILDSIRNLFTSTKPIPAGIYHYQAPLNDPRNYRLHLRVDQGGRGSLVINAATVLHLNETATEYAFYLVQRTPENLVVENMVSRYRVEPEIARQDFHNFVSRIDTLIHTPDLDPTTFLNIERQEPFSGPIMAPYRMDCALTYQLTTEAPGVAPIERVGRELTTEEWKTVLDKAWEAGILHVVFTGGEPTLRTDLVELISHAEMNNQVTGLLSDGIKLSDPEYLNSLLNTGLDHLLMIFRPEADLAWQALENALAADLFVAVHLTLTRNNQETLVSVLDQLVDHGVTTVSLSTNDPNLGEQLQNLRDEAAARQLDLVWNLPTPYSALNPVALETHGGAAVEGAGRAWIYVEPDGDVLPTQGVNRVMGNILHDPWEQIWKG